MIQQNLDDNSSDLFFRFFRYKNKAQKLSQLFRDRPSTAMDTAVFWTEYVIRHRGAPHMHYPGADLNFIQRNSLDVIAFLLLVLYILFKITKLFFKMVFKFIKNLFTSKKSTDKIKRS